ncbi:MAG: MaoC family dehydratase N-terminal domain-containing protein, partial [Stenotrophomonas sp.]
DPFDEEDLRFVLEYDQLVLPTILATVGAPGAWAAHPDTGIDWMQILHGEHRMQFFDALPPRGKLLNKTQVVSVVDKGAGKGALVTTVRDVSDAVTGKPLARVEHVSFCRAD